MAALLNLVVRSAFFLLLAYAAYQYVRHRDGGRRDILLLLASIAGPAVGWTVQDLVGANPFIDRLGVVAFWAFPLLQVRLIQHTEPLSGRVQAVLAAGLAVSAFLLLWLPDPYPLSGVAVFSAYFVAGTLYGSARFVRAAVRYEGATRRRHEALATGSALIGFIVFQAVLLPQIGVDQGLVDTATEVLALLAAIPFMLAFVPPRPIRSDWHLTNFLAYLRHRHDAVGLEAHAELLARSAVLSIGGRGALVTVFTPDGSARVIGRYVPPGIGAAEGPDDLPLAVVPGGPAAVDVDSLEGPLRDLARSLGSTVVMAVPIGTPYDVHGCLLLFRHETPLFPEEFFAVTEMMADQLGTELDRIDRLERQQELVEELERSNEELDLFAHTVSHDLKNPLTAVIGNIELVLDDADDRTRELLGDALGGAERIDELLNGLLQYARLGSRPAEPEAVDVEELLEAVRTDLRPQIEDTDAQIRWGSMPTVQATRAQVYELLLNLLGNALKFRSKEPPVVEIRAKLAGDMWRFEVEDNGVGIPPRPGRRCLQDLRSGVAERRHRGDRSRSGALQEDRRTPRRGDLGRLRTGPRLDLLLHPPRHPGCGWTGLIRGTRARAPPGPPPGPV